MKSFSPLVNKETYYDFTWASLGMLRVNESVAIVQFRDVEQNTLWNYLIISLMCTNFSEESTCKRLNYNPRLKWLPIMTRRTAKDSRVCSTSNHVNHVHFVGELQSNVFNSMQIQTSSSIPLLRQINRN